MRDIGTNFHHIDGNPANNDENNIAILCVQEHDQHHRPNAYNTTKHLELGAEKIREYKQDWEQTVKECKSDNPKVLAIVSGYGDSANIHSAKFLVQNSDSKIIYERLYHLHFGTRDEWINWILEELIWLGIKVPLCIIDEPLDIKLCPCCSKSFSTVLDKNATKPLTSVDWKEKSVGTIYISPTSPMTELTIFYGNEILYQAHLNKCDNTNLHFHSEKLDERIPIIKNQSVRTQAKVTMQKVVDFWKPGRLFIGTGNKKEPTIIDEFNLPAIWEKKNSR